ncbi:RNA polymerase sigma factor RpoH [Nitrogeniibacter mangrovi]|uniref:RNA polymerase sigma factor RpoH n=1 Tax=Nitrogeniibacter mangrovi TaxID=2016596 RepID=A0A6C1B0G9_9RHOO|nr:RNA polymerase sigma factor RpoH [Nitrogeniibacter mangrovi]QID17092.1 RNA polymerase sigma factor RpoH [Nitrogeniibacter mangrovi]
MTQLVSLPVPTAVGSIDQYIQFANRVPVLSEQEERDCATRFHDDGDLDAARRLVLSHLRLVVAVARGYLGYGLPHADLIQEGNIGLMKAVKRFDPRRGVRLVSFAIHWIKAEIHEYILKNWRLVKVATTKAQRKLFFNLRSFKKDSNALSPDDVAAVAAQLGVKPEEVVEMETRLGGQDVPLDSGRDDDDDHFAPIAYLPDPGAEPAEVLEQAQQAHLATDGLRLALENLDERSRRIITARWLNEDGKSATLHELADEYGVSAERIRQIEAKAMKKMRGELATVM